MSIRYELTTTVKASPEEAFALIDDLPQTANWLPPCVSLEKLTPGPNTVGDQLRYVYQQGGKQGEMAGEIVERVPGKRLFCKYTDPMFDVLVDLNVSSESGETKTTHIIEIVPKKFMAKLMSPIIRMGLGKQTRDAAANFKKLLES